VSPRRQSGYYRLIVKVGSRLEAEMKLRSEKQVALPKIEIDLSKIQQLSHERDEENWEFRSWLKQYAPDDIDVLVKSLSRKYFTLIDCTECGNCCRSLHVEFKKSELHIIAKTLGHSIETFQKKYMSEGNVNPPCPMLNGKLCSIYENRPDVCRSFPHLEQPEFTSRLIGVIDSVAICPIAFNAFEELKTKLTWTRGGLRR
jgi:Fe-S-cluster containining protein